MSSSSMLDQPACPPKLLPLCATSRHNISLPPAHPKRTLTLPNEPSQTGRKRVLPPKVEQAIDRASQKGPERGGIVEKVWLIRRIGEMVSEETMELNRQRQRIKRNVDRKYRKFGRSIGQLVSMLREEPPALDRHSISELRRALS